MKRTIFVLFALSLSASLFANDWQEFMTSNTLPTFASEDGAGTMSIKPKNPKLAFAMSAVVPGGGQVYSKSYVKAAAFVGVEVAAWAMYLNYNKEGRRLEDNYHAYAADHWSEDEYWRWIAHHAGLPFDGTDNTKEELRRWESEQFSHGLHRDKDQQYYEMIGKYHQFSWGWDDFRVNNDISISDYEITQRYNNDNNTINENRLKYETKRNDMNAAYKKATTATTFVILNHILSAVDAAWTTSRYNKRIQVSLRVEPIRYAYETETALTLRVNW